MTRFRSISKSLLHYPPASQALFAIAMWPVLFAIACWQTPQLAEFLVSQGLEISMWQVFLVGFGAYLLLLGKHRVFNRRHFKRHAVEIAVHHRLSEVEQDMVSAGLTDTRAYKAVNSERARLRTRLGFLVDADNFYRKLKILIRVFSWLHRNLKKFFPY